MTDGELAYLAGVLDGDGSVVISPRGRYRGFQLFVGAYSATRSQCELFAAAFGGRVRVHHHYSRMSGEPRTIWAWQQAHGRALDILTALEPHLLVRLPHVAIAREFRALVGRVGPVITHEQQAAMAECRRRLRAVVHEVPRRVGLPETPVSIEYLAGLFDAEGSISFAQMPGNHAPRLDVVLDNTVDTACLVFADRFGGRVREANRGRIFHWARSCRQAQAVLEALLPHLHEKRAAAEAALAFRATNHRRRPRLHVVERATA